MDSAERSDVDRQHRHGSVQDPIVDPDEIDSVEDIVTALDSLWSEGQQCPRNFGAGKGAGYERSAAPDVPTQRRGL